MRSLAVSLLVAGLVGAPALAFGADEGVLTLKMMGPRGVGGQIMVYFSKAGTRTELEMTGGPMPMKMVSLMKASEKDHVYQMNPAQKKYTMIDLTEQRKNMPKPVYKVEVLGKEKIANYNATHAKVSDQTGNDFEVWTSKDLPIDATVLNSIMKDGAAGNGFWDELKKAKADGFVVKMESKKKDMVFGIELVKAEVKPVEAALFQIPGDYQKAESPAAMMGGPGGGSLPPEAQKALEEQLKKMTPEQREAVLRQMRGQQPPPPTK